MGRFDEDDSVTLRDIRSIVSARRWDTLRSGGPGLG